MIETIMHGTLIFLGCVGGVTLLSGAVLGYIESKKLKAKAVETLKTVESTIIPETEQVLTTAPIITPVVPSPVSDGSSVDGVHLTVTCNTTITDSSQLAKFLTYARDGLDITYTGRVTIEGPFLDTLLKIIAQAK